MCIRDRAYQPSESLFDRFAQAALERIFGSIVEAFVKRAEATLTPLVATGRVMPDAPSPPRP